MLSLLQVSESSETLRWRQGGQAVIHGKVRRGRPIGVARGLGRGCLLFSTSNLNLQQAITDNLTLDGYPQRQSSSDLARLYIFKQTESCHAALPRSVAVRLRGSNLVSTRSVFPSFSSLFIAIKTIYVNPRLNQREAIRRHHT